MTEIIVTERTIYWKGLLIIGILILIVYLVSVNLLAGYKLNQNNANTPQQDKGGSAMVNIGVGDSISVQVVRERWYGKIYGDYWDTKDIENLYLFNIIKIPVRVNGSDWSLFHIIFVSILILLIVIIKFLFSASNNIERGYKEYETIN